MFSYHLEFSEWYEHLDEYANWDNYDRCADNKEDLEKVKKDMIHDMMNSMNYCDVYNLMYIVHDTGLKKLMMANWDKIKDRVQEVVSEDVELCKQLLECAITDDLIIADDTPIPIEAQNTL